MRCGWCASPKTAAWPSLIQNLIGKYEWKNTFHTHMPWKWKCGSNTLRWPFLTRIKSSPGQVQYYFDLSSVKMSFVKPCGGLIIRRSNCLTSLSPAKPWPILQNRPRLDHRLLLIVFMLTKKFWTGCLFVWLVEQQMVVCFLLFGCDF